jgi:hypothetical protein
MSYFTLILRGGDQYFAREPTKKRMQGDCEATGNVFPHGAANSLPFALEEKKIIEVEANDALLRETKGRFVLFPLKFPNVCEVWA